MAKADKQLAADNAAVEEQRAKFGDTEAAKFAADLYKLRRTPAPASSSFAGFPRGIIILVAIWVALLETAEKLPFLLLAYPQYQATLAEIRAKMLQPDLVSAQLDKARSDAKTAAIQPDLTSVQLDKTKLETKAAAFQPDTAKAQLEKTKQEAQAAAYQPDTAAAQLEKTKQEAKAASFQPALTAAQAFKAEVDSAAAGMTMEGNSATRLHNMFDLLDPNHPMLVSRGLSEPNISPLIPFVNRKKAEAAPPPEPETPPVAPQAEAAPPPSVEPTLAPTPPHTTPAFDCKKKSMPADFVICSSQELVDMESRLEDYYRAAKAAKGGSLKP